MRLRSLGLILPLTALLASSAVSSFGYASHKPQSDAHQNRSVVARGKLTGSRTVQQVVIWRTGSGPGTTAHLAVQTTGARPRTLWQADERSPATRIDSVRVADLDGDGMPEIIGVWRSASSGATLWDTSISVTLRVFRWDPGSRSFVELYANEGEQALSGLHSYRISGRPGHRRIIVYKRATSRLIAYEFEVRGSEIVSAEGGASVTPRDESGIEGQAVISPARPGPQREGDSGTAPYQTTLVVISTGDGREVARVQTGSDGRFRVSLPPGEYHVGPSPEQQRQRFPRGGQQTVTVLPRKFSKVTIGFDSGMR